MVEVFLVKFPSDECRGNNDTFTWQHRVITRANVDLDLRRHITSLRRNWLT